MAFSILKLQILNTGRYPCLFHHTGLMVPPILGGWGALFFLTQQRPPNPTVIAGL